MKLKSLFSIDYVARQSFWTVSAAPAASPGGRCVPGVLNGWASSRVVFHCVLRPLPLLGSFEGSGSVFRGEQGCERGIGVGVRG